MNYTIVAAAIVVYSIIGCDRDCISPDPACTAVDATTGDAEQLEVQEGPLGPQDPKGKKGANTSAPCDEDSDCEAPEYCHVEIGFCWSDEE